jgi:RecA-family ATPase
MGISTLDLSPTKGRALLLAAEDDQNELHRRFDAIARAHGRTLADLGDLRVASLADVDAVLGGPDKSGNVIPTALWHRTLKIIESFRPAVVGLDTLADLSAVDEIKRNQARAFIAMIRKAAIKYNFTGILLAHPSLSGLREGTGTSGSTGWNNSVRSRLYLTVEKGSDVRTLQHVKSNYGGLQPDIQIVYNDGIFVRHDPSKPAIADGLINGRNDNLFMAVLSKLNRTGQRPSPNKSPSYAPRMIQKHPDAKGTKVRDMEMAMQRLLDSGAIKIVQEGPPSRRFSRLIVSSEDFGGADDG